MMSETVAEAVELECAKSLSNGNAGEKTTSKRMAEGKARVNGDGEAGKQREKRKSERANHNILWVTSSFKSLPSKRLMVLVEYEAKPEQEPGRANQD